MVGDADNSLIISRSCFQWHRSFSSRSWFKFINIHNTLLHTFGLKTFLKARTQWGAFILSAHNHDKQPLHPWWMPSTFSHSCQGIGSYLLLLCQWPCFPLRLWNYNSQRIQFRECRPWFFRHSYCLDLTTSNQSQNLKHSTSFCSCTSHFCSPSKSVFPSYLFTRLQCSIVSLCTTYYGTQMSPLLSPATSPFTRPSISYQGFWIRGRLAATWCPHRRSHGALLLLKFPIFQSLIIKLKTILSL